VPVTTLYTDLPERLGAARDEVSSTRQAYENAVQRRNRLIVTAVDHAGMSQGATAKLAGMTQPSVVRILSRSDELEPLATSEHQAAA
jgi:hypothetical protein